MYMDPFYMLIIGIPMALSWLAGRMLQSRFQEYSQIPIELSGKEIAEKMLRDNGITDVQIISTPGQLTDHYNPTNKTVNLSEVVYNQRNVAAAAVSAHECGHAIQHATAYSFLSMRSKLVPVVSIGSKLSQYVLMAGIFLFAAAPAIGKPAFLIGILLFGATTLFSFITLPVEFDASNRALKWLDGAGVTNSQQHAKAKTALKWAASTYVVAALASLGQLIYWVMRFMAMNNRQQS